MGEIIELRTETHGAPILEKRKVMPRRRANADLRPREHLTPEEIERLIEAARKSGRYRSRDEALVLIAWRHGLRVSELIELRWDQIDFKTGLLQVTRCKNGSPSTHPVQGDEMRILRRVAKAQKDTGRASPFMFTSERGAPMKSGNVRKIVARLGRIAGFEYPIHPHQLRHACGYALANAGHDTRSLQQWLGHKNIMHTVRYTELSPDRFRKFWRD